MLNRVFGNRYRLTEKIGIGGMAEVYKATDEVLGRTVAVKVMLPQYASDPTFAARFKQEAQAAANLQSPYIVNIYDWGHDPFDNTYFIVMEYVRGTDLKTAIKQRGAINQRKAAEIGSQVCAALTVAHGYDIIHRDIKPHNIMVQPDGNAKVMDFGIARANGSATSMTQTGSVLGTAYYVSPEQAQGKPLTPATDLYSLGIVLYETTTGQVPFDAPDAVAVALKQVSEQPIPPSRINPNINPELEAIILRAMSKNPLDRYSTAEQMRTALNNYLAGRPVDTGVETPAAKTRVMGAGAGLGAGLGAGAAGGLPVIGQDGAAAPLHTAVMPSLSGSQQPLNVRSSAKAREEEEAAKHKRTVIITVAVSTVVVIGAVVALLLFLLGGDKAEYVNVPDVLNKTQQEATDALTANRLKVGSVKFEASATVGEGLVVSTNPSRQTKVKVESTVDLVISSGPAAPKMVQVPDLRNKTEAEARDALIALKLVPYRGDDRNDPEIAATKVCGQDVAAGNQLEEGRTVTFYLSKGKETGRVPVVMGQKEADAVQALEAEGFKIAYGEAQYSNTYDEGTVMSVDPPASTERDKGTTVTIIISKGPKPVSVPSLLGLAESVAKDQLRSANLDWEVQYEATSAPAEVDHVIRQTPGPGEEVLPGRTIVIVIGISSSPSTPTNPTTP